MATIERRPGPIFGAAVLLASSLLLSACGASSPHPRGAPPADPIANVRARELYKHGVAFAQAGDFVRAEQYIEAAIGRGYPQRRAIPMLMRVCIASSRLREALTYADPYLDSHPNDWPLRFLVASIELGLGNAQKAHDDLESVVRQAPRAPDPHFLLAVVLRDDLGEGRDARTQFRRYLALAPHGPHAQEARAALEPQPVDAETGVPAATVPAVPSPATPSSATGAATPAPSSTPPAPAAHPSEAP